MSSKLKTLALRSATGSAGTERFEAGIGDLPAGGCASLALIPLSAG
jgi:hypothetical protein